MKRSEAYPSKYLSADDITNGPKIATVRSVAHEAMQDGKVKPVVYLDGYQKGVVVNRTNAEILYVLGGGDDDQTWPGVTVELYTESTRRPDGKPCLAIRFRMPPRKPVTRATVETFDDGDSVPF